MCFLIAIDYHRFAYFFEGQKEMILQKKYEDILCDYISC